jgi:NADPH2:quinone reductase
MGELLVQLAAGAGAEVVAAARGGRKLALARELGAAHAVDYTDPGWPDAVLDATGGKGPDLVLDGAGGDLGRAAFAITAPGGRFSAHGSPAGGFAPVDPDAAAARGITLRGILDVRLGVADADRLLRAAVDRLAAGTIRPVVGRTFPLAEAAAAHRAIEARDVLAKTLLLP